MKRIGVIVLIIVALAAIGYYALGLYSDDTPGAYGRFIGSVKTE